MGELADPFDEYHQASSAEEAEYEAAVTEFKDMMRESYAQANEFSRRMYAAKDKLEEGGEGTVRYILNLDHVRAFKQDLARNLLSKPSTYLSAAEEALKSVVIEEEPLTNVTEDSLGLIEAINSLRIKLCVGITGPFGQHQVSPRGLLARFLTKMVCVEGIVTKVSLVRPKLERSIHWCPSEGKHVGFVYRDATSLRGLPTLATVPTKNSDGKPYELEYGLSTYRNNQRVTIQEMPERAPLGQLPRSVDVILEHDLVDRVKPGDRVQVSGVYRALAQSLVGQQFVSGNFRTAVIGNCLQTLGKDVAAVDMTDKDISNIRKVGASGEAFDKIARSLAPSIYGHSYIKKALLLLLLGGLEKNLPNGTHLRGDINLLLVGDPSTAKSQLLRFVLGTAPLAISTTGRGSTGVGLTAAVTSDPETGERRLEAGAMVLGDRGVVLIDEFDKMGDADRVAIHEVMEQQTVTIAKAGIHASLNARCSVVAAANPIYGAYDRDSTPQKNVGLPDSLLSRFDLLFIVLDQSTSSHDRAISDHILRMHRYERPGKEGVPLNLATDDPVSAILGRRGGEGGGDDSGGRDRGGGGGDGDDDDHEGYDGGGGGGEKNDTSSPIYQKFNHLLHGGFAAQLVQEAAEAAAAREEGEAEENDGEKTGALPSAAVLNSSLFSTDFIRKYITYAKSRVRPELTDAATQMIAQDYADLRQEQATKTLPITPRCLETMIRLSTAHAKARLSPLIEAEDVRGAKEILYFALFNDTELNKKRMKENKKRNEGSSSNGSNNKKTTTTKKKKQGEEEDESSSSSDSDSSSDDDDDDDDEMKKSTKKSTGKGKRNDNKRRKVTFKEDLPRGVAKLASAADDKDDDEDENEARNRRSETSAALKASALRRLARDPDDLHKAREEEEEEEEDAQMAAQSADPESDRFNLFLTTVSAMFLAGGEGRDMLNEKEVIESVNRKTAEVGQRRFSQREAVGILEVLDAQNKIMYQPSDGMIYKI